MGRKDIVDIGAAILPGGAHSGAMASRTTRGAARESPLIDALNKRCRVWWHLDRRWYPGTIAHWTSMPPESVRETDAACPEKDPKGWFLVRATA